MANIKLYFKTRHRNRERINKDASLIYDIVYRYSQNIVFTTYSNSLIIFNVNKVDIKQRMSLLNDICNKILYDDDLQALDMVYYSII